MGGGARMVWHATHSALALALSAAILPALPVAGQPSSQLLDVLMANYIGEMFTTQVTSKFVSIADDGGNLTPEFIADSLKLILETEKRVFGTAMAFEPGKNDKLYSRDDFDEGIGGDGIPGPTESGEYSPYAYRGADGIVTLDLADSYEEAGQPPPSAADWYTPAKKNWKHMINRTFTGYWGAPYFDLGGGDITMVTYTVPMVRNDGSGRKEFFGVVTIDIDIDDIYCVQTKDNDCGRAATCLPGFEKITSFDGDTLCLQCPPGKYDVTETVSEECHDCPMGGYCPGGDVVLPLKGYWQPENSIDLDLQIYSCETPKVCCYDESLNAADFCRSDSEYRCIASRSGDRCASCAAGYARFGEFCLDCEDQSTTALFKLMILLPLCLSVIMASFSPITSSSTTTDTVLEMIDFGQLATLITYPVYMYSDESQGIFKFLSVASGFHVQYLFSDTRCPFQLPGTIDQEIIGHYSWLVYGLYLNVWHTVLMYSVGFMSRFDKRGVLKIAHTRMRSACFRVFSFTFMTLLIPGLASAQCVEFLGKTISKWWYSADCDAGLYKGMRIVGGFVTVTCALLFPFLLFFRLSWMDVEHSIRGAMSSPVKRHKGVGTVRQELDNVKKEVVGALRRPASTFKKKLNREKRTTTLRGKAWKDITLYGVLFCNLKAQSRVWYPCFIFFRRGLYVAVLFLMGGSINIDVNGVVTGSANGQVVDPFYIPSVGLFLLSVITLYFQVVISPYRQSHSNYYAVFSSVCLTILAGMNIAVKRLAFNADNITNIAAAAEARRTLEIVSGLSRWTVVIWCVASVFQHIHFLFLRSEAYQRLMVSIKEWKKSNKDLKEFGTDADDDAGGRLQAELAKMSFCSRNAAIPNKTPTAEDGDKLIQLALDAYEKDINVAHTKGKAASRSDMQGFSLVASMHIGSMSNDASMRKMEIASESRMQAEYSSGRHASVDYTSDTAVSWHSDTEGDITKIATPKKRNRKLIGAGSNVAAAVDDDDGVGVAGDDDALRIEDKKAPAAAANRDGSPHISFNVDIPMMEAKSTPSLNWLY